ncbi:MAG: hypothetical protein M3169_15995 [Candidatus Eremiobacteraeota bacterium]|nr:hypothetical protein [Candidatus Eremiobacteraeota bacterium]
MNQILSRTLRPLVALALGAGLLLPVSSSAQTAVSTLLGNWTAPAGGTVSSVVIGGGPGAYTINIKAPCSPTPCDWGTRPLTIYAASPAIKVGKIGSATYNQGFVTRIVVVTAQDAVAPFLRVDVYSKFAPGDTRSNYATTQTLH